MGHSREYSNGINNSLFIANKKNTKDPDEKILMCNFNVMVREKAAQFMAL